MNKTIFYTDDDQDDRDFFKFAVDTLGNERDLYLLNNGQALLNMLEDPPPSPNIIFLDLNMPGKNGFDVLSEIRASEKFRDVPVVIFSTSNDEALISRSFTMGASLYITKPPQFGDLIALLKKVFLLDLKNHIAQRSHFVLSA